MTPLGLRAAAGRDAKLVARPRGVLHAYTGPLTPSGRWVPRAGRTACHAHTRTLAVVSLPTVGSRRVCGRCTARLTTPRTGEAGRMTRDDALDLYRDVTPFDLAVDAWRAETVEDVERDEWLALLVVGYPACKTDPVIAPTGKENPPLDDLIARARRRVCGVRDSLAWTRDQINADEANTRDAAKARRGEGRRDREARIERLGFINATTR